MAKTYRVSFFVRLGNLLATTLVRAGVKMGPIHLLTVRGRTSGKPRTTPVAIVEQQGKRYLIAPFGMVNWVRNLRAAAGEAALTRSRRTETIHAIELEPRDAAPVLKTALQAGGGGVFTSGYFAVTPDASLEDFEREAPRHPVFLVQSAA
ncbi:MAG: nitroreductase/quinone reductase family protein [Ktedonobacterales bacterium]